MPAKNPTVTSETARKLRELGRQIRHHRKMLGVNATVAAESAAMSRVTWHRIEIGAPSVTMGAYINAMAVLGLDFGILPQASAAPGNKAGWIPARINLAEYPQLKQLAWHIHGTDELTAREALDVYERNGRHLDLDAMTMAERQLFDALRLGFGRN